MESWTRRSAPPKCRLPPPREKSVATTPLGVVAESVDTGDVGEIAGAAGACEQDKQA